MSPAANPPPGSTAVPGGRVSGRRLLSRHRALRIAAVLILGPYCAAALVLLLTPSGWAVNRANVAVWIAVTGPLGLQETISPDMFQAAANVVLFIPPFAALAMLIPTWWWVMAGFLASSAVETYQLIIGSRQASLGDVLTNTTGAAIGTALGVAITRAVQRRDAARCAPPAPSGPTTPCAAPPHRADGPGAGPDDRG